MKIDKVDVVILMCKYLNCETNSTRYDEIKEFVYKWFDDRDTPTDEWNKRTKVNW